MYKGVGEENRVIESNRTITGTIRFRSSRTHINNIKLYSIRCFFFLSIRENDTAAHIACAVCIRTTNK